MLPHSFNDPISSSSSHYHPSRITKSISKFSEPVRFFIASFIGTVAFLIAYEVIFWFLQVGSQASVPGEEFDGTGIHYPQQQQQQHDSGNSYAGTIAWLVTYTLSIWLQHELNHKLVFINDSSSSNGSSSAMKSSSSQRKGQNDYWRELGRTYLIYTGSMILSTMVNMIFTTIGLGARSAMLLTLVLTGFGNYFLLNKFM